LGVDTSEPVGSVALYDGGRLADERRMDGPLRHAEQMFPLIDRILYENRVRKGQVGLVCVNRGPGSFTGLRIGLSSAMGFCQASGAALVGVGGVDAYRARVADKKRVWVIIASRRDVFYVQSFAGARARGPIRRTQRLEVVETLQDEAREATLIGSAAAEIGEALQGNPWICVAPSEMNRASALWIATLGWSDQPVDQLWEVEPLYVEPLLV